MTADNKISTIQELLDWMAQTRPGSAFLISPETGQEVTFQKLQEHARLLSSELLQAGLEPGDKIAFLLDNGLFTAQLFLGVMYGGFVAVPLNVRAGVSQLSYTLDHCDAKVVYVSEDYRTLIQEVMANVQRTVQVISTDVDNFVPDGGAPDALELPSPGPEDPALLMYTSGSTGQPKAAIHSHRTVLSHGRNSISSHQLSSSDRSLLVLPLYHINAECVTLVPTLMSGGSVVVPHRFSVSQFWDWLDEYKCTWSAVVPTIISQLLDWPDPRAQSRGPAFQRIRFLRSSSAPLAPSLHREFLEKFKLLLIQAMGSSEAGNVFSNPLPPSENKIGSPGVPWGFEAKIVNREGIELPPGESGEVLLRGPAIMQGYYKQPEETAAVLDPEGWLQTGDLAYRDEDGYFFVVGRSKELIIKGGVNIAPRQIDDVLESHPAVLEAASVGVPDHYLGEDLVAFVVRRAEVACDENELLRFCEQHLGHFKTPTRIYFATDLPKGPSGKVQRLRLRDEASQPSIAEFGSSEGEFATPHSNGHVPQSDSQAPASSIEQVIAESWAEVLSQSTIDPESNFFALGGHSLLAVKCVSLLREKIPVALSLSDFFENATVAQQAALVRQRLYSDGRTNGHIVTDRSAQPLEEALRTVSSSVSPAAIPPRDRTTPYPLSPAQQSLWFTEQLNPGLPVYNEVEAVRLLGELNVDAMERALNVIVARHEILRTTVQATNGEPMAIVHETWPIQLKQIDLGAFSPSERQIEIDRLLTEEPRLPYRLEAEPGIRATLLCLGSREYVLILMMHHIICDWSSEGVLWRELSTLYRSFSRGEPAALPPLTIQHGDYAVWQAQQDSETSFAEDLAFWEANLRGAPQLLELPADRTRLPILSHRGARQRFILNPGLTKALRDLSQRAQTTLFTVFAAALNTLMYRYTRQEDILMGIPIADRDRKELQQLIGFLLHIQVLRTELSGDMTFRQLLGRVQKAALELYLHRAVPFDQVVRKLQPERNLSYSPLFQVMLNWRDRDQLLSFIGLDKLTVESLLAESKTSKFDLTLFATDCGDEIWLEMEYSTDLFDDARITRMVGHYQTLLESVARDPEQRLAELPLLTPAERHQMLVEWNQTELAYPKDRLLHQLIEDQVERTPDGAAVVFGNQQLTFRQLNEYTNSLAHYLKNLGVGPNVLVGICVERSLEMLVGLLGVLKAGGAYVPLDPAYPKARFDFILDDAQARVVLTTERHRQLLEGSSSRIVCLDTERPAISKAEKANPCGAVGPSDLAYVIYTSGSTGVPKGVAISHGSSAAFVHWAQSVFSQEETAGVLFSTSICFDLSVFEIFVPLSRGGKVILVADALHLRELPAGAKVTLVNTVPSVMKELIRLEAVPPSVCTINLAGEPLPVDLVQQIYELPHVRKVYDLYGPSETTTYSTFTLRQADGPGTIGRPIANTQIYILDSDLQPVPVGVTGELCIAGVGLARGYLNRPELTAMKFIANPFSVEPGERLYRTGDMARYLPDGSIEFLGRMDRQVKIRGFRIELGEVEAALKKHPDIGDCVVVAREHSGGDKRLEAYVVPSDAAPDSKTPAFRDFLKQTLPKYMLPAAYVRLESLPLTPNGKLDRNALLATELDADALHGYEAPLGETEATLAGIWAEVLEIERVGRHDNFFELGGHSLLAVRVISRLRQSLSVEVAIRDLFTRPVLALLAEHIISVQLQQFDLSDLEYMLGVMRNS